RVEPVADDHHTLLARREVVEANTAVRTCHATEVGGFTVFGLWIVEAFDVHDGVIDEIASSCVPDLRGQAAEANAFCRIPYAVNTGRVAADEVVFVTRQQTGPAIERRRT